MTRPIGKDGASLNWASGWASQRPTGPLSPPPESAKSAPPEFPSFPAASASQAAGSSAPGPHLLGVAGVGGGGPVTPGSLAADGQLLCRGLLRAEAGQGLIGFHLDKAPARGLAVCLAPGQIALVLRNGEALGLSVDDASLESLRELLPRRLSEFGQFSDERPEWALGLDMGPVSGLDRSRLSALAREFRLGIQDLTQGVWVLDRFGGLHADWPPGVRFEAGQG